VQILCDSVSYGAAPFVLFWALRRGSIKYRQFLVL
jgi:hypothetical protein